MTLVKRHYQKARVVSTRIIRQKGKKNYGLQKDAKRI